MYDLEETADGATCDCGDFVFSREGLDPLGCKHIRAARMMGLIGGGDDLILNEGHSGPVDDVDSNEVIPPCCPGGEPIPCAACITIDTPLPDEPTPEDWADFGEWARGVDARAWDARIEADDEDDELAQAIADGLHEQADGEGPLAFATDECFDAVAEGRADWAREYGMVPVPGWTTKAARDEMLADQAVEDGWASRPTWYREYLAASLNFAKHEVDEPAPEPELPMAELVDLEAARYRGWGTALGDLLAERMDALAAQMRMLEATTPDQFRDRRDAMIDSAKCQAEARLAAAGC